MSSTPTCFATLATRTIYFKERLPHSIRSGRELRGRRGVERFKGVQRGSKVEEVQKGESSETVRKSFRRVRPALVRRRDKYASARGRCSWGCAWRGRPWPRR